MLLQSQTQWHSWWPSPSHHKKHTHGGNLGTQGFNTPGRDNEQSLHRWSFHGQETSVGLLGNHTRQMKPQKDRISLLLLRGEERQISLYGNTKPLQKSFVFNKEENLEHGTCLHFYYTNQPPPPPPKRLSYDSSYSIHYCHNTVILRGENVKWHLNYMNALQHTVLTVWWAGSKFTLQLIDECHF